MEVLSVAVDSREQIIKESVSQLENCGLIVYPTDTIYGLGADATRTECVKKVFEAKKRDDGMPISVLVSSISMLKRYADVPDTGLLRELLPGRVTVVLDGRGLAENLSSDGSIGFRLPVHDLSIEIADKLGRPLTATSANVSGKRVPSSVNECMKQLGDSVGLYIDAGSVLFEPSTVVDLRSMALIREGSDIDRVKAILK